MCITHFGYIWGGFMQKFKVFIDWLVTIIVLVIGLYNIILLVPMELIGALMGQTIVSGVQYQKISAVNIILYLIFLSGIIALVIKWKKKTISFWLKILGATSIIICKLLWALILLPQYIKTAG